ncbi:Fe-S oxidoreductase [Candidatus Scalindua japonica]|uniref:Fe-S oxidoreductase n=1 Tax=Candidatus Scalindua japonica TaxID=1284222 RepID=A0A286TTD7_9BACT|nr:radical SAM protein [Candidatus Scalindua japonica]GAX59147.1 Fe-S oxidoreductase [Candidatus Scalindua japonica]
MKIELISPSTKSRILDYGGNLRVFGDDVFLMYGLALTTIAAYTPSGVEISITDENLSPIDFEKEVDLVGLTSLSFTAKRAYEIAAKFRQRGVKVVMGGVHATMLPEEALEHVDIVVIGEAEDLWPQLIDDFRNNSLKKIYRYDNKPTIDTQPIPRHDLLEFDRYLMYPVNTTRGCPYNCEFCTVHAFFGKGMRRRQITRVIEEIAKLRKGIRFKGYFFSNMKKPIAFVDDSICGDFKYAKELFRSLIPLKTLWWGQASLNFARDDELLDLMSRSGCISTTIGFESIKPENLDLMNKKINRVEEYKKSIDKIHSQGIYVYGAFITGNDGDSIEDFKKLVDFINDNNITEVQITVLTPCPGTKLSKDLDKESRILHKDWNKYDGQTVVFKPKNMTPDELQNGLYWTLQQVFSYQSIYKRLTALWSKSQFKSFTGNVPFYQKVLFFLYFASYIFSMDASRVKFVLKIILFSFRKKIDLFYTLLVINSHDYAYSFPKGIDPQAYREKIKNEKDNRSKGK